MELKEQKLIENIERATTSRFAFLYLWIFPTFQYTAEGFTIEFKKLKKRIVVMNIKKTN